MVKVSPQYKELVEKQAQNHEQEQLEDFRIISIAQTSGDMRVARHGDFEKAAQFVQRFKHRKVACLVLVEHGNGKREILPAIIENNKRIVPLRAEECEHLTVE